MEPKRRQQMLLGVLIVVLAVAGGYWFLSGPAVSTPAASNVRTAARGTGTNSGITAPEVHLDALQAARPRPSSGNRNLFRFKPKPPPPAPSSAASARLQQPAVPDGPPPPPPVPPIALKFLGVMEAPERGLRVATLSDGRGVYSGVEGDIIEGRYRIIRIGTESIEMTHLDGTGRQVIRLSGS